MQSFNWAFCSDTSRRPRDDELIGNSYHFTSRTEMEVDVKAGRFLEHGEYDGNLYGTKIESIHEVVDTGRTCILDVNPQVRRGQRLKMSWGWIWSYISKFHLLCVPSGSEGTEDSRVHALRGVHRSAWFWDSQRHAQSRGGRGHHHQAADGRSTSPVHIIRTRVYSYSSQTFPPLAFPPCVGRMWTWGRRWTRALGSRGPTATTSTWPSSTTTWTRPLRRYKRPWTNCAVNPSGSRWTGCTEDQRTTLSGSHWPNQHVCVCACVCFWPQRPKKRRLEQKSWVIKNK